MLLVVNAKSRYLCHREVTFYILLISSAHSLYRCGSVVFVAQFGDKSLPPLEIEITAAAAMMMTCSSWILFPLVAIVASSTLLNGFPD